MAASRTVSPAPPLYLSRSALCARWRISRQTSYKYQAQGYLPPPVRFGPGTSRWPLAEIEELERRAAADRVRAA